MTTVEPTGTTRSEIERLRAALQDHGLTADQVRSAMRDHGLTADQVRAALRDHGVSAEALGERVASAAESRGSALRERLVATAHERAERRRRLPRGLSIGLRTLGLAWVALMVSTLAMAIASRASTKRVTAIDPEADEIRLRADLGPLAFTSRAKAFKGGTIDCWYGGGFVDLREATLDPAGARLRVRAVFGGGQLIVPDGWRIVRLVRGIGGLTDLRPATERGLDAPVLTIEGLALFGGFSVESTIAAKTRAEIEKAVGQMGGVEGGPAAPAVPTNGHDPAVTLASSELDVLAPV